MERYVNNGSPTGWHKRTSSYATSPFTGKDSFPLLEFDDTDIETQKIGYNPLFEMGVNYAHPDSIDSKVLNSSNRILNESSLVVVPTSGARTMLIQNQDNLGYLKLTYDIARLGRVDRHLTQKHCYASYEASETIKAALDSKKITANLGLQLETAAKISYLETETEVYDWGVVYREFDPYPYRNEKMLVVPGFSLFGSDTKHPDDKVLISQFIANSGISSSDYLINLLELIVDCYWQIVLSCGFNIECHGQNCFFEVDKNLRISRMIIRDMDSIDRDIPLERYLGIKSDWKCAPIMCLDENIYYYNIRSSYMYDFKLGEYLLSPLIECVSKQFGLNPLDFEHHVKRYVQQKYLHLLPDDYFTKDKCWYNCDNTERKPGEKRKYYAHPNPKFR